MILTSDTQPPSLAPENRHPSNVQLPHSQAEKTVIPPPMPPRGVSRVLDPPCQPLCCSSTDPLSPHLPGEASRGSRDTELGPLGVTDQDSHSPFPATLLRVPVSQPSPHTPPGLEPSLLPSPPHLSGSKRLRQPPGDEEAAVWSISPLGAQRDRSCFLGLKAATLPKHCPHLSD